VKKQILAAVVCVAGIIALAAPAKAVGGTQLAVGKFALEKGVFNTIFAKEICSCQFVDGLTLQECQERDNLPPISHSLVNLTIDPVAKTVTSTYKGRETINDFARSHGLGEHLRVGGPATARFDEAHPEFGCVLTKLPDEP